MRRVLWAALAALFVCGTVWGQGAQITNDILRPTAAIPGASIKFCTEGVGCPALANVYTDRALTTLDADSIIVADARGSFTGYVAPGCYNLQISAAGFTTLTKTVCAPVIDCAPTLNGIITVGCGKYTTIQAAINAANALSPKGSVEIPATFSASQTYTNAGNVQVIDRRGSTLGVWGNIQSSGPVVDGSGNSLALGNDLNLVARGPADLVGRVDITTTTATTTVAAPGTQAITVGSTANFYSPASIVVDRWGANEETITDANYTITDGTTITATFANAHTQPYTVDQWGAIDLKSWLFRFQEFNAGAGKTLAAIQQTRSGSEFGFEFRSGNDDAANGGPILFSVSPVDRLPRFYGKLSTGMVFYGSNGGTGTSGVLYFRNNSTDDTSFFTFDASAPTVPELRISQATNTSLKLQAASDVARYFGGGTASQINFYPTQTGTGTSGIFAFLNNAVDETVLFKIGNTGKATIYDSITTVAKGVPAEYAEVNLTVQGAAIGATTFYAVPAAGAGQYRVCFNMKLTQAATTSSVLGGTNGFQLVYTDQDDSVVVTTVASLPFNSTVANLALNTTQAQTNGCLFVNAKASTNIQYQVDYTSVGATPMQYNLHIRLEAM